MRGLHGRVERGLAIASSPGQIDKIGDSLWFVRSQSGDGGYLVGLAKGRWKCNCPDFRAHDLPCKHLVAVRSHADGLARTEAEAVEARRPRPTYRQNWPAYNAAQNAEPVMFGEVLTELVSGVVDPVPARDTGRPRVPLADLLYCAVEKVYRDEPLRNAKGRYAEYFRQGRISCQPSQNMPAIALARPELSPILSDLVNLSALPLVGVEENFAVDSSGFRTTSFGDYCREKYGAAAHNVWVKPHILVGTLTHVVVAAKITEGHVADCPQLPELVGGAIQAGFVLKEVYADKGYLSGANYAAIGETGATPYIMFKENSRGRSHERKDHSPFWKRMWHLFQADPSGFLDHYHKRENVEAVFGAIKKKLGETLSSRNPTAQINELYCKLIAYNITVLIHEAFERGIEIPRRADRPRGLLELPSDRNPESPREVIASAISLVPTRQENN